ncbi:hypothetical protein RchiOBHm_Chr4g0429591 [Rosa chinensis]|uniref:Uncharacterized protein n=1 Tax=Rosa chinensis TaxID=74649 RepID=A0A2P6R0C0_ROSCH|nr:hypothetical protein RchiOBHm_Chr4g0429591 [Rosa chinensis]
MEQFIRIVTFRYSFCKNMKKRYLCFYKEGFNSVSAFKLRRVTL